MKWFQFIRDVCFSLQGMFVLVYQFIRNVIGIGQVMRLIIGQQDQEQQNHMKQSSQDELQKITPLLKIVKARQELYLQLLNFVSRNIDSSSNQHQQLSLFTKFLQAIKAQQKQITPEQKSIISHFEVEDESPCYLKDNSSIVTHVTRNNKQILRLCSRLIEILDASISKTRKSIFNENGRLSLEFTRFKRNLHNIVKGQTVHLGQFTNHILSYIRVKYKKQIAKIQKYIYKLQSGAIVALKQIYFKEKSDESSPDQKQSFKFKDQQKQEDQKAQHNSQTDSPNKKSLKKPLLKSTKKGHRLIKSTKKQKQLSVNSDTKPPKQYAANKLYKFYAMLDISKKQFYEDLIYEKNEEEQHSKRLMSALLDKNKTISGQINSYYRKSLIYQSKIKQLSVNNYVQSSGEQKETQKNSSTQKTHSMLKNSSLRKSFVISKRKSSLNFQKNSKILTQHDEVPKNEIFIKTIKNFTGKRKTSAETTQRSINKSKKLFVIKSPVMFQDDNIPQAPAINGGGGWFRAPLTSRKTQKKTENLRLKRRNNPIPMQKSLFNESFKFTDNQL